MSNPSPNPTDNEIELFKMFKKPEPLAMKITSSINLLTDDDHNTELHYAAANGRDGAITKELLKKHTIDAENYLGWTPLMMACRNGHLSTVQLLLKLSADASKKNKYGYSVFHISISSGKMEIVSLILKHLLEGGISRRSMQNILSPVSLAIVFQQHDVLEFLSVQFDIDKATPLTGITPLMFATAMEDTFAYDLLIKNKAIKTIKNYLGVTADQIKEAKEDQHKPEKEPKLTPAEIISMSPYMTVLHSPCYPPPNFMVPPPEITLRKSSNTMTPSPNIYMNTPNVTPITPMNYGLQYFFPPDFSPGHYCSCIPGSSVPLPMMEHSNDFLNARMNQSNMFLSPMMGYPSPCV
ncbi:nuclear factor NF-kappa-B p105 subunit [Leptinotarsa decemlineata]|uniref:nuclear factor NF-kappa-B p105 subunit n=1 Tax=Leptinotarsa decemlineata TaxID=7539 RepID=UPI003D30BBC1